MGVGSAVLAAGAVSAGASVLSGMTSADAAKAAASTQAQAADAASANQLAEFQQIKDSLAPFLNTGTGALSTLAGLTGTEPGGNPLTASLTKPFSPTMADLAATPGYQFTLGQGEQATTNGYAAQGLANSGPALKGAANYAEGLASTTYQNQFSNYLSQNQQIANILSGQVATGENAAALTGNAGTANVSAANSLLTSGAAASAGGTVGAANATTGAINSIVSTAGNTGLLYALQNNGLFGSQSPASIGAAGAGP